MIRKGIYLLIAASFFALTTTAVAATAGWTPSQAAAKVKATYATVDPKAAAVIQANIDQEKAGCGCDTNARIVSLLASLKKTQTAAKVTSASCKGSGKATGGRYSRFHCSASVAGVFRAPPDYKVYTGSVKLTVTVSGSRWRVLNGWH